MRNFKIIIILLQECESSFYSWNPADLSSGRGLPIFRSPLLLTKGGLQRFDAQNREMAIIVVRILILDLLQMKGCKMTPSVSRFEKEVNCFAVCITATVFPRK